MTGDLRDQVRNVAYQPREPHEFRTVFGPATVSVGAGFDQVVVTLTSAAAEELARVIAASKRLDPHEGTGEPESDLSTWFHVVVDLLASAALCNPAAYKRPSLVPLRGTAR